MISGALALLFVAVLSLLLALVLSTVSANRSAFHYKMVLEQKDDIIQQYQKTNDSLNSSLDKMRDFYERQGVMLQTQSEAIEVITNGIRIPKQSNEPDDS